MIHAKSRRRGLAAAGGRIRDLPGLTSYPSRSFSRCAASNRPAPWLPSRRPHDVCNVTPQSLRLLLMISTARSSTACKTAFRSSLIHLPGRASELGCPEQDLIDRLTWLRDHGCCTRFGPFLRCRGDGRCVLPVRDGGATDASTRSPKSSTATQKSRTTTNAITRSICGSSWRPRREQEIGATADAIEAGNRPFGRSVFPSSKSTSSASRWRLSMSVHNTRPRSTEADRSDPSGIADRHASVSPRSHAKSSYRKPTSSRGLESFIDAALSGASRLAPNHYALGMTANGMTVWDIADEVVSEVGRDVGALPFVTHCYRAAARPAGLALQSVCNGARFDREEVEVKRGTRSARLLGPACRASDILYSKRILKKTGLRLSQNGG